MEPRPYNDRVEILNQIRNLNPNILVLLLASCGVVIDEAIKLAKPGTSLRYQDWPASARPFRFGPGRNPEPEVYMEAKTNNV